MIGHVQLDRSVCQTTTAKEDTLQVKQETKKFMLDVVQPILKLHFKRDEFLGRINEFVIFHPFSADDLGEIVNMELQKWRGRALARHNLALSWSPELAKSLADGFQESYGFRSLKHEVERRVISVIVEAYERNELKEGQAVKLSLARDGSVVIKSVLAEE